MPDWLTRVVPALYRRSGAARLFRLPAADPLYLAAFFAYKRFAEDPFAALARRQPALFLGGDILDIGANAGYTSAIFARALTPGMHVYAFEPEAVNLRRLHKAIRRRRLEGVITPLALAIGAQDGSIRLAVSPTHPGDHRVGANEATQEGRPLVSIPMRSIDSLTSTLAIARVRFVKIDVQGYELEVSRGMEGLLARSADIAVAFEYAPSEIQRYGYEGAELLDFYESRGFRLFLVSHDGALTPFSGAVATSALKGRGYTDILALRG